MTVVTPRSLSFIASAYRTADPMVEVAAVSPTSLVPFFMGVGDRSCTELEDVVDRN